MDGGADRPAGVRGNAAAGIPWPARPASRAAVRRCARSGRRLTRRARARFSSSAWSVSRARARRGCSASWPPRRRGGSWSPCGAGRPSSSRRCRSGSVVDALDDQVEAGLCPAGRAAGPGHVRRCSPPSCRPCGPAARPARTGQPGRAGRDLTGRYRVYRAMRRLLEDLAGPARAGADPRRRALGRQRVRRTARPPGPSPAPRPGAGRDRLPAGAGIGAARGPARLGQAHGRQVPVGPLTLAEAEELLGPGLSRPRCQALHEASGGNPFYLEALARMEPAARRSRRRRARTAASCRPRCGPRSSSSWTACPQAALRVAQAAAVAADEFEPALVAVAAEVTEDEALAALNEMAARDIVRPGVRRAAAVPAPAGAARRLRLRRRRLAARRARADRRAPGRGRRARGATGASRRAVGPFGDQAAIATLVEAAREVAAQAPATAAHWLEAALGIMPVEPSPDRQLELLLEVARLRAVSGQLTEGREAAREVLRRLPLGDHARRALGGPVLRADGTPARPPAGGPRGPARRAAPDPRPAVGDGRAAANPAGRREPDARRRPRRAGGPGPHPGRRRMPWSPASRWRSRRCGRCPPSPWAASPTRPASSRRPASSCPPPPTTTSPSGSTPSPGCAGPRR